MTQALKSAAISAKILARMQAGATVYEAIDAVLGAGASEKLVGDLYVALRAKAGA